MLSNSGAPSCGTPCHATRTKLGGTKRGCCLPHKAFEDLIPRSVHLLQLQSLDLWSNCLGVMVVAARVQWSEFNRKTLMWACLKSKRTEDRVRSRPRSSAVSFTIMNMRLYVFCCLLWHRLSSDRQYKEVPMYPYLPLGRNLSMPLILFKGSWFNGSWASGKLWVSLSKQLLWLHINRLSFTLKSWAELPVFVSAVYARALPETVSNWHV